METTLFSFIWKHSRRQQIWLLVLTLVSFPFLYASLELPKKIVNDAIGSTTATVAVFGQRIGQIEYLFILCALFLATVLAAGLLKMHINTRKGMLAERMLRRLRYQLIGRMLRFPRRYFRTTSQGELVAMITAEAEPLGGLMGDAIAQPVFQFGQMATIVAFLFVQSLWFGLAAVALIPLQAWLIPMLQRQINLLNKDRIREVRRLASEIGETAAGIGDLRVNGGLPFRRAMFTDRLGRLFDLRFRIYRKKYFMKFLNNLISQVTPFLFYSVGGYLAIRGEITVGALVAALGAHKDLSAPWGELLAYYTQLQDMTLRWAVVMERFAPADMIPEPLIEGVPETIPRLNGAIEIAGVTVVDQDGNAVLEDIDLTIPPGARVAVQSRNAAERAALGQLLVREVLPARGRVSVAGQPLGALHQAVIAARIGYAQSRPYLFDGSLGDNLLMPLKVRPRADPNPSRERDARRAEARRAGNSADLIDSDWIDPALIGLADDDAVRDWWFRLVEAMGADEVAFRRNLHARLDPVAHPELAAEIVRLRPQVRRRIAECGLDTAVHRFDPDGFNPAIPLGGNLLFASAARAFTQKGLAGETWLFRMLDDLGLTAAGLEIAAGAVATLSRTFGRDDTGHPLFLRLGIEAETFHRLVDIVERRRKLGDARLGAEDRALLLTVVFMLTAEQIGPGFPDEFKARILALRRSHRDRLLAQAAGLFVPFDPQACAPRLTVLENALYGRVAMAAGAREDAVEDAVAGVLDENGLRRRIVSILHDLPAGIGGAGLPADLLERAAFSRAAIKRPDILILDAALASLDPVARRRMQERLGALLPGTTMIFLEDQVDQPEDFDMVVRIRDGRIDGAIRAVPSADMLPTGTADLIRKLAILAASDMFGTLDARNRRLLAYSAAWFDAAPGQVVFAEGQAADAVYLCLSGRAELRLHGDRPGDPPVSMVVPGRLIGELAVIQRGHRTLDLVAVEPTQFLRIGAQEFRAVIENDARVAARLLEQVARQMAGTTEMLHLAHLNLADFADPPAEGAADPSGEGRADD